jgi:putative ABC transport system permease protein
MMGDLEEAFYQNKAENGLIRSLIWYFIQLIKITYGKFYNIFIWSFPMIKNYFRITLRNLMKNKTHSIINILGLGVAIAGSILILLFVKDEVTFDHFHKNLDGIYQVEALVAYAKDNMVHRLPTLHIGPTLKTDFAEVEDYVRIKKQKLVIKHNNALINQDVLWVDPSFFQVFSFPLISSNQGEILGSLQEVMISQQAAEKYFGQKNPLGKSVSLRVKDQFEDFIVTGIAKRPPANSSIQFDFLLNLEKIFGKKLNDVNAKETITTFILLSPLAKPQHLTAKFPGSIDKEIKVRGIEGSGHMLHRFKDYHLDGSVLSGSTLQKQSEMIYSVVLSGIAFLVLLIACFNFTNLSIGRISQRFKEIAMRKVMGAQKNQIAKQFLFDSFLNCMLAFLMGILLARVFLPAFNGFTTKSLSFDLFGNGSTFLLITGLCLFICFITGGYPAVVFSRISSLDLFKGKINLSSRNLLSRILIILQFTFSIFLIVSTLFMHAQYRFMVNKNLGYNSDQVIDISLSDLPESTNKDNLFYHAFKNILSQYQAIKWVSGSNCPLTNMGMVMIVADKEGKRFAMGRNVVDYNFFTAMEMKIKEGRNFSQEFPSDMTEAVIVNETFVKQLGVKSPVGRQLSECFKWKGAHRIIGILRDFNSDALKNPIRPTFFTLKSEYGGELRYVYIKLSADKIRSGIEIIKKEFKKMAPGIPFKFNFLDDRVARQYEREKLWSQMVTWASTFALVIACSGLFGLTLLIVVNRTREIGIRKVLGASVLTIIKLINREFLFLVILANFIAWPISYFVLSKYFQNYAYRIPLSWWVFVLAGFLVLSIAFITVTFNTLTAARSNPVEVLRTE